MSDSTTVSPKLGGRFAEAFAGRDAGGLAEVLHPDVDFRGLTPSRAWEAQGSAATGEILLGSWIEASDEVDELVAVEDREFMDRESVRYHIRGHNEDGPFDVEQQVYFTERDGRIGWMRVLCSGFRPGP
jgi:hypothetical protein